MKKYLFSFFLGIIFCFGILTIFALSSKEPDVLINFTISGYNPFQNVSLDECYSLDLVNTSYCFSSYVSNFYNYTHDRVTLAYYNGSLFIFDNSNKDYFSYYLFNNSIEEYLRIHGGVCSEWSLYYNELCKKTNFSCKIVSNEGIEGVFYGHQYLVMYNETNYCKLDGIHVSCGNNWVGWY